MRVKAIANDKGLFVLSFAISGIKTIYKSLPFSYTDSQDE